LKPQNTRKSSTSLLVVLLVAIFLSAWTLYCWSQHTKVVSPDLVKLNNLMRARTYKCSNRNMDKECKRIIKEISNLNKKMLNNRTKKTK